jgi:hypothetical protein
MDMLHTAFAKIRSILVPVSLGTAQRMDGLWRIIFTFLVILG